MKQVLQSLKTGATEVAELPAPRAAAGQLLIHTTHTLVSAGTECMGMGIPVLMSLPEGEATAIVRATGCGACVPPENPGAMAAAIEDLSADREKRDRLAAAASAAAPRYSRDELAASMLSVLQRCSGKID